jgi:hypothetical protein
MLKTLPVILPAPKEDNVVAFVPVKVINLPSTVARTPVVMVPHNVCHVDSVNYSASSVPGRGFGVIR